MSLDGWTIEALKDLSEKWSVSKAEVIRRAVRELKQQTEQKDTAPSPLEALKWLQTGGGMVAEEAAEYRAGVLAEREARKYWWES
jgi:Arc/MetJ-type ribon-helix-helix transcriptional regulator